MENIQGNVENVSQKTNACQIDGVWYTLGQNVRMQYVKRGPCEYSVQQTDPGQNDLVVFVKSIGQTPQQPQTQQPGAPQGLPQQQTQPAPSYYPPQQQGRTDEEISRMSALKAASRIYQGTGQEEDFKRLTGKVLRFIESGVWIIEEKVPPNPPEPQPQ